MRRGISVSENTDCEGTPGEGIMCRAGRSAFWIRIAAAKPLIRCPACAVKGYVEPERRLMAKKVQHVLIYKRSVAVYTHH